MYSHNIWIGMLVGRYYDLGRELRKGMGGVEEGVGREGQGGVDN